MKKLININSITFLIIGLILGGFAVYATSASYSSDQVLYNKAGEDHVLTSIIEEIYDMVDYGDATANDIRVGKKALVKGKQVVGKADIDESPYIYEATLYCGWWTNYGDTLWGNWSGNMTITDETGATVATAAVGTSRSQMYSFTGGASGTKAVRFSVPRPSIEEKTYNISLYCGWWTNHDDNLWGNWSGSVTVQNVSGVNPVTIKSISVGTRRDQMYSFDPPSGSGSTSGSFTNQQP